MDLCDDAAVFAVRRSTPDDVAACVAIVRGLPDYFTDNVPEQVARDLERTLTDDEANVMRDRIYAAIHRGTAFQWAVGPVGETG